MLTFGMGFLAGAVVGAVGAPVITFLVAAFIIVVVDFVATVASLLIGLFRR